MRMRDRDRFPVAHYGPIHGVWLALCVVLTWVLYRPCRLIRLPVFIRGKRNIVFGPGFVCGYFVRLDAFGPKGCISFGKDVQINDSVHIGSISKVEIGNNVLIASRVFITDHDHGGYGDSGASSNPREPPSHRELVSRAVIIGDNVWIGENVSILPGSRIGEGSIIGAGAVVKGDIPPNCIAVGIPAVVVKRFDDSSGRWRLTRQA